MAVLHFVDKLFLLSIERPHYKPSTTMVCVYAFLLLKALCLVALLVWQMKTNRKLKDQYAQTVEEKALRMAAEKASHCKNAFISHISHEVCRRWLHCTAGAPLSHNNDSISGVS